MKRENRGKPSTKRIIMPIKYTANYMNLPGHKWFKVAVSFEDKRSELQKLKYSQLGKKGSLSLNNL